MKNSCLVTPLQAKHIEFGIWIVVLEEVQDVEFDETKGSQVENKNLEDVRGIQLSNAMKNMDVGELRPRQVNDDKDDQVQVLSNTNLHMIQIKLIQMALMTMNKIKWLVHHLNPMIKQVQAINFQYSNQPYCKGSSIGHYNWRYF